ncbi:MAG: bifunctional transaldolase/phosoglucose isomerase [Acidobacteriota bacterium]|nr:bifunctional transaldolase/phosoglucose isomerase [Acidobacteriota bacterium]
MSEIKLNSQTFSLPDDLRRNVEQKLSEWNRENKIERLWAKDAGLWTNEDEAKWLGWLTIVEKQRNEIARIENFQNEVRARGFSHVLLLGMGGSSLAPEVLSFTFGKQDGFPEFHILDSTVPAQVRAVEEKIDLANTLFIVASKSGSTLEPNCFKQYFFERVAETVGRENAGNQFVAITDPNSKMQQVAERDGFWRIFFGLPEIGGRFSVLSDFGMIPAAAMGLNAGEFLDRAALMVEACQNKDAEKNPGVVLGAILGTAHRGGRDKLTIFTSPQIFDLGAWLEQLIAESTGKNGVAIIPIDREEIKPVGFYSNDRIFVHLKLESSRNPHEDAAIEALARAGQPIIEINLPDVGNLGQEFFRWEIATAVAGSVMQINPFNQPDVESAKIEARKITEEYEKTGALPQETPFFEENGIQLFTDERNLSELNDLLPGEKSLSNYLRAHFERIKPNDYFALLAYLEMNADSFQNLSDLRHWVFENYRTATCLGFGPRFLHSTGQAYKGGANNGVFLQITNEDSIDFPVPEQKFTFGVVKAAQARGDFQVLLDRNRRALRVHLGQNAETGLEILRVAIEAKN